MAGAILALGVFVLSASSALASGGKIKVKAEVQSVAKQGKSACAHPFRIRLSDGGREVGEIKDQRCAAAGLGVYYRGTARLEIGKLQGHLHFSASFHAVPPNFTEPSSGTGEVYNAEGSERLTIEGPNLPSEVGASFAIILNPKVGPPL